MDVLAALQQIQPKTPYSKEAEEVKQIVLEYIKSGKTVTSYNYFDYEIASNKLTIDEIYEITEGKINYKMAKNLYKKCFYLAKSRLRTTNIIKTLRQILTNDLKYTELLNYMQRHTYGIEPEVITRSSKYGINISDTVGFAFRKNESELFKYIMSRPPEELLYIIKNPQDALKTFITRFYHEKENIIINTKDDYYANSIIDLFDWQEYGVEERLSSSQRQRIIDALKKNQFMTIYFDLRNLEVKEKDIAKVLFTNLIKSRESLDESIPEENSFNLLELKDFIGYNRFVCAQDDGSKQELNFELRNYQRPIIENINKILKYKQFASSVLPTGGGKTYIALAWLLQSPKDRILYLAPNDEILNQVIDNIIEIFYPTSKITSIVKKEKLIAKIFPNLKLKTYSYLSSGKDSKDIINCEYDKIILDELHRSGAPEWQQQVKDLLDYQEQTHKGQVRVLGITATPERDMDSRIMTEHWAKYYGYTDDEIKKQKHMAVNMDIEEAIKCGYVINPKFVNCEYSIIASGRADEVGQVVEDKGDKTLSKKYETLRRSLESSSGIEKILGDNLKTNGKYIVFLPVSKREDEDGNSIGNASSNDTIQSYQLLISQWLFTDRYMKQHPEIKDIYLNFLNTSTLSQKEIDILTQEQKNILAMQRIQIIGKPLELNTRFNDITDKIIKKLGWQSFSNDKKREILTKSTKDIMNCYSMLGSYSKSKNKRELSNFDSDESPDKMKFMFVMNKLNEGVHLKHHVDGMIWLRPLDETSKILFLQQLGRCIYSLNPKKTYKDEDRPVIMI